MSCRTTSGGSVSTSLARMVSGLTDKDIQHLFHALKREGAGQPVPSEVALTQWRERQQDMLERAGRMSEKRKDAMRNKLFRSRTEPVPDGSMFYAWSQIEARARQDVVVRSIETAVDLAPPGSQADQYELGEDGRPVNVMYASYGSNLHRDRFMTYIEGGTPPGGRRHYPGCTDRTEPEFDIPIRYHGGYRTHFALTSSVWHGGIAFLDKTENDESATALGRAYKLSIDQFDEVVHFENGGYVAKSAQTVPLDEVLAEGRSVTGPGVYETMMHIGDYEGMPVLTFTAPFSAHEALTRAGSLNRNNVRLPVMTNKPSPAYCRMIGQGLQETFGIDEVAAADYLRGMPGAATAYSRQDLVKILRQPAPAVAPAPPEKRVGYTPSSSPAFSDRGTGSGSTRYMDPDAVKDWMNGRKDQAVNPAPEPAPRRPAVATTDRHGVRYQANKKGEYLPGVKTYDSVSEQTDSVALWALKVKDVESAHMLASSSHAMWSDRDANSAAARDSGAELERLDAALAEVKAKHAKAQAQAPESFYPPADTYFASQWSKMAGDATTKARLVRKQIEREQAKGASASASKISSLEARAEQADKSATEATAKAVVQREKFEATMAALPGDTKKATGNRTSRRAGSGRPKPGTRDFYAGVKTYPTVGEQEAGAVVWRRTTVNTQRALRMAESDFADAQRRLQEQPSEWAEREVAKAQKELDVTTAAHTEAETKHRKALSQNPHKAVLARGTSRASLRRALDSFQSRIEGLEANVERDRAALARRSTNLTQNRWITEGLAEDEDRLVVLCRARDAVLDALDAKAANAVKAPKSSPVRNKDKSA